MMDSRWLMRRTKRPLRSLGENHVDLGGMVSPASATSMTWATDAGCREKATPPAPARRSSPAASVPPTNEMRGSSVGFATPSTGPIARSCRSVASSEAAGSSGSGPSNASSRQAPNENMPTLPGAAQTGSRRRGPTRTPRSSSAATSASSERPFASETRRS